MTQKDERYALGVSAQYAGTINGLLIQAGGCNFPDKPAAEGGTKVYYDHIYALNGEQWEPIGKLPVGAAYGVTVATGEALYLMGGLSEKGQLRSVLRLTLTNGQAQVDSLADLPCGIDNMTGAVADGKIYLVGGSLDGQPSNTVLCGDLAAGELVFEPIGKVPGAARMQAVSAGIGKHLYVVSGYCPPMEGEDGYLHETSYRYDTQTGEWESIPAPTDDEGSALSLAGGCGIAADGGKMICVGGVNRDIFPIGLNGIEKGKTWLSHPVEWYRFNRKVMMLDTQTLTWKAVGEMEGTARAGGALVKKDDRFYMMQGEIKPGMRTAMITEFSINPQ